jgi:hypothetical protein
MSKTIPVPTLSTKGWVTSRYEKCDLLLAQFYASDVNQSNLYAGQIANVQGLIEQYMHDIDNLKQGMRDMLERYLGRYYDQVSVTVSDDSATNASNKITLYLSITVIELGAQLDLAYAASFIDSKFEKILNLNNTGNTN